ncbi:MAG: heme exporter protein CcmB [Candidatus Methanospirare jalkutatii]|nr:MAG: heme exporter protein CcmB [Candidatus Methanospirare jalkutatii]UYZ40755.1 MAG: heme exporter protein CcmB [Candidatus Methanospirare jalkutatii]
MPLTKIEKQDASTGATTAAFATLLTALKIAEKDLRVEFRRPYELLSVLTFSLASILVCGGSLSAVSEAIVSVVPEAIAKSEEVSAAISAAVSAAFLWTILFFASILVFTTSFTREADKGTLLGLKTIPCNALAILLGKILYSAALLFLIEIVLFVCAVVFLNAAFRAEIFFVFFLSALSLASAGSFISALVMFSEGKTLLLSFLLFPVSLPVLISGSAAIAKGEIMPAIELLIAFLLLIFLVMSLTFEFVIEE